MNFISKVKDDLSVLKHPKRNFMIDNLRALAILMVVFHHFNGSIFKVGFLGVDIFFVLSGYLVSSTLLKEINKTSKVSFRNFYIKRIFKILPSYYLFLFLASIVLFLFASNSGTVFNHITLRGLPYYLFLFQNYSGYTTFYHVWSLCVEEHFYIFLPIAIYLISHYFGKKKALIISLILLIIAGNIIRLIGYYKGVDTYAATHNRVDALAFGVLLAVINIDYPNLIMEQKIRLIILIIAVFVFFMTLYFSHISNEGALFQDILSHTFIPLSIFFILLVSFPVANKYDYKLLKFISFYSYNWYLWHFILIAPIQYYLGTTIFSFGFYLIFTFLVAFLITHLFEIPLLNKRKYYLR